MATFKEMQDEVLAYGFDATVYRTRVSNWLNEAQSRIARAVEIPDLWVQTTITTIVGTTTYTKPADLIQLKGIVDTSAAYKLRYEPDYLQLLVDTGSVPSATGRPQEYSIAPTGIILSPVPDAVYSLIMTYYKDTTALVGDGNVSLLPLAFHDVMVSYTLQRAYRAEDDAQMAQFYQQQYQQDLHTLAASEIYEVNNAPRQVRGTWG